MGWLLDIRQKQEQKRDLHRFAEFGQLSTALFHDLANNLMVLSLDIQNLKGRTSPRSFRQANHSLAQIEKLVDQMRSQLKYQDTAVDFNPYRTLTNIIDDISYRFKSAGVGIKVVNNLPQQTRVHGDPARLSQVLTVLITNALDATISSSIPKHQRRVCIELFVESKHLNVSIIDWGMGIENETRHSLFRPFTSTKPNGMGIGLFLTRQIVETHFKGSIKLVSSAQPTVFQVRIPISKY